MPDLATLLDKNRLKSKNDLETTAGKVIEALKKNFDSAAVDAWGDVLDAAGRFFDTQQTDPSIAAVRTALDGSDKLIFSKVTNKGLLSRIIDTLDHKLIGAVQDQGSDDKGIKDTFSMSLRKELLEMSKYACGDAARFTGAINKKGTGYYNPQQILNREWRRKYDSLSNGTVSEAKLGICTTFAQEAKNLVVSKRNSKIKRVEVVAVSNHVFALVNRKGGSDISDLDNWGWDAACYVVDVWLGTLGHDYIYQEDKYGFLAEIRDLLFDKEF